jgi:hypothetical protein
MRKFLASALAAVTFGGAVAATAAPAQAERYQHRYYRHHGGGNDAAAAAIVGGIAGLAIGAALSSKGDHGYYGRSYYGRDYGRGYYRNGYVYDPGYDSYRGGYYGDGYAYRTCIRVERFYDPYIGRDVRVRREYPC